VGVVNLAEVKACVILNNLSCSIVFIAVIAVEVVELVHVEPTVLAAIVLNTNNIVGVVDLRVGIVTSFSAVIVSPVWAVRIVKVALPHMCEQQVLVSRTVSVVRVIVTSGPTPGTVGVVLGVAETGCVTSEHFTSVAIYAVPVLGEDAGFLNAFRLVDVEEVSAYEDGSGGDVDSESHGNHVSVSFEVLADALLIEYERNGKVVPKIGLNGARSVWHCGCK
jgi:hypothetical protein